MAIRKEPPFTYHVENFAGTAIEIVIDSIPYEVPPGVTISFGCTKGFVWDDTSSLRVWRVPAEPTVGVGGSASIPSPNPNPPSSN